MKKLFIQKLNAVIGLFLISTLSVAQQGAPVKDVDMLSEKEVMTQHYPGVFKKEEIRRIEKMDDRHSKVYYERGGANFEAIVNSDRKDLLLVATCQAIPENKVPKVVRDHFHASKVGSEKIKNAFVVKTPVSSDFYRLDIVEKDKNVKSVFYDHLGTEMKAPY